MSDLVSWLREQLDQDERVARGVDPDGRFGNLDDSSDGLESGLWRDHNAVGISSARVLAEVESKRKILETCATLIRMDRSDVHHDAGLAPTRRERNNAEWFLRLMTAPYRDRPGYDPAWGAQQ